MEESVLDIIPDHLNNNIDGVVKGFYKWPFKIDKLFYERAEGDDVYNDPQKELTGLMSRAHISGFVYELVEKFMDMDIAITATLIQQGKDTDAPRSYRIDMLDVSRYSCDALFDDEHKTKCRMFEKMIADIFIGLRDETLDNPESFYSKIANVVSTFDLVSENPSIFRLDEVDKKVNSIKLPSTHGFEEDKRLIGFKYNCPETHIGGIAVPISVMGTIIAVLILGQFAWDDDHKAIIEKRLKELEKEQNCSHDCINTFNRKDTTAELLDNIILDTISRHVRLFMKRIVERIERNENSLSLVVLKIIRSIFIELDSKDSSLQDIYTTVRDKVFPLLCDTFSVENISIHYRTLSENSEENGNLMFTRSCLPKDALEGPEYAAKKLKASKRNSVAESNSAFLQHLGDGQYALHFFRNTAEKSVLKMTFTRQGTQHFGRQKVLLQFFEQIAAELYSQFIETINNNDQKMHAALLRGLVHELGQQQATGVACVYKLRTLKDRFVFKLVSSITDAEIKAFAFSRYEQFSTVLDDAEAVFNRIEEIASRTRTDLSIKATKFNIFKDIFNALAANYRILLKSREMHIEPDSRDRSWAWIHGDKTLIQQAVNNLLSNAFKYSHFGTNVYYACTRRKHNEYGECAVITVVNYGIHINDAYKDKIFQDGFRINPDGQDGMGYGLSLVKRIAVQHGGGVEVESKIICPYAVPFLKAMQDNIKYDEWHKVNKPTLDSEIKKCEDGIIDYNRIVNSEQRMDLTGEGYLDPYTLFNEEGIKPTAKTTFSIYLPINRRDV